MMISKVLHNHMQAWCQENGWTDLFVEQYQFWAFPPGSVLPIPVPAQALEGYYKNRVASPQERLLSLVSIGTTLGAVLWTTLTLSPLPLLVAFGGCAIAVGLLEEDPF